jgi:nucleotidyltransferase substrate binding protein (TIGR01987 family)
MNEIFDSFKKSIGRLDEILKSRKTIANRDSAIKRFELTFELSWKTAQQFLKDQGLVCRSPRECFKELFRLGLIEDDGAWIAMMEDRNQTVHTYHEETADTIYGRIPSYLRLFQELHKKLSSKS